MKRFVFHVSLLLLIGAGSSRAAWDYLHPPVDLPEDAAYKRLLEQKLYQTPFDYGRVTIEPPYGNGEHSISVYSQKTDGLSKICVSFIEATDSLRDWTDVGRDVEKAGNVKIRRIDAEISARAADLIRRVWIDMLSHVRATSKGTSPQYIWGDATIATFSIQQDGSNMLSGEALVVPDNGKRVSTLIQLADLLQKYCKADAASRPAISKRIEKSAASLLGEKK